MRKLNRPTDERIAILRNQASDLLWNGRIETTLAKAKDLRSYVEKILTLAINTFEDTVKVTKETVNEKGAKVKREVINDGPKKLAARTENIAHPLIEKIFNEYAPKYAQRKQELGIGGGYTRIVKLGTRNGDNAEMAIIELV